MIYADIHCISHDGNLADAIITALNGALQNSKCEITDDLHSPLESCCFVTFIQHAFFKLFWNKFSFLLFGLLRYCDIVTGGQTMLLVFSIFLHNITRSNLYPLR